MVALGQDGGWQTEGLRSSLRREPCRGRSVSLVDPPLSAWRGADCEGCVGASGLGGGRLGA